jgi:glyoxylase-like metal-dependent hydrolase (beta-lactamase superfamily II)
VRFAILSHHHSDHMGGAKVFAGAGATLIVAPGDRGAALRAAGGGSEVKIETVKDRRVITDGVRTLEVRATGRNPHTRENLFAWLPEAGVLFQGDLFYYEEGTPFPPAGRETMNRFFARWLEREGIAPRAIYGVHNYGAAGVAELEVMRR